MEVKKIKVPEYIQRMIKENKKLTKKIDKLRKALENKEFKKKTSENQRTSLNKQLYHMSQYQDILGDRIGSDMSDKVKEIVATKGRPFSVDSKGEVVLYDNALEAMEAMIGKIEEEVRATVKKEKNGKK